MVISQEKPYREEICINGYWEFQPVNVPSDWISDRGEPPTLRLPNADYWEKVPIKIPSPWNVNSFGHDPKLGGFDARTFPSYPEHWNKVQMGWLRKNVLIPDTWKDKRISLHLEAVAGDCRIMINGKEMGFHFDTSLPADIDITSAVAWGQKNEILLGIRSPKLYSENGTYGKLTYPTGSMLANAVGVWQDVYLIAMPQIHVNDVFMQPMVDKDLLVADIELVNDTDKDQTIRVQIPVYDWINHTDTSKKNILKAPEISWSLGKERLRLLSSSTIELKKGEKKTISLKGYVKGCLEKWELWTRGEPYLYMAIAEIYSDDKMVDKKSQRFGWRQVKLDKGEFYLNGQNTKLFNDGWHFTGIPVMTRRYAWAWYTLAKDANINIIRPHAMPYPRYFYDMADEMGMLIMDESGIFGSHINFNYDSQEFWQRNREHIKQLVRRDRNHPSIVGWSVSNEIWCVLRSRASKEYQEMIYDKIFDLCKIASSMDPTRQWVQSDGDKDLNGRLDVWTIHCGGSHNDVIPPGKLWGVTEGGSSYYGKPGYYEQFVGDRAYRSFNDRMDGLAREDYNLIRTLRQQDADIMNVWNLVWHGMKPLPIGLTDISKKQLELTDGIIFGPYVEGKPGIQPERIAPFSTTVNPGYDPSLPLYDPHPLYLAMQAAMHPEGSQPCEWDHFDAPKQLPNPPLVTDPVESVLFAGNKQGKIYENLKSIGVPFSDSLESSSFMIIDVGTIGASDVNAVNEKVRTIIDDNGTILIVGMSTESQNIANNLLPEKIICMEDMASSLIPNLNDARTACLSYKELYFAENFTKKIISRYSLQGDLVQKGKALLYRNNTDWLRWLNGPEHSKTISIYRSELENKQSPVLVELQMGHGRYLVSTFELENLSDAHVNLYRKVLSNLGLKLRRKSEFINPAFAKDVLVSALVLGRFGLNTLVETMDKQFINEQSVRPIQNSSTAGLTWVLASNEGDRFILNQLKQDGPQDVYAVYFSYWVYSPIDLGDLLNSGPDLPQVSQHCYVSDACKLYVNGQLLSPQNSDPVDYRIRQIYNRITLKQGWNHFLIKMVSDSYANADPGTLAVRIFSNNETFDQQLKTAVQITE